MKRALKISIIAGLVLMNGLFGILYLKHLRDAHVAVGVKTAPPMEKLLADYNAIHASNYNEAVGYLKHVSELYGGEVGYDVLRHINLPEGSDVHLAGHEIGNILFKQQGLSGMRFCTQEFRNACSHTIVIGALLKDGLDSLKTVHEVCHTAPGGSGAYTMCFHGLGHGVLAYSNYDMKPTVDICKTLGTKEYNNREYTECVGGAVMEMMSGIHDPVMYAKKKDKYLSKDDPLTLCRDYVSEDARSICYTYLTPHLIELTGANLGNPSPESFGKAAHFCDAIPKTDIADRGACFGGFGKEFPVLAAGRDIRDIHILTKDKLERIKSWCATIGGPSEHDACNMNLLASLYWGGENKADVAINYCSLFSGDERKRCFDNLSGQVSMYKHDVSAYKEYCSMVPSDMKDSCDKMFSVAK